MKYVDEFRDAQRCRQLLAKIREVVSTPWTVMEVCGGQTHGLLRYGIDQELAGQVHLIHGPGCPVCVTPPEVIDTAVQLARRDDVILATFGDMLRVPGTAESLMQVKSTGGNVRVVYSPLDAVTLAGREPARHVVFLAVGFETTAPATALAVQQAGALALTNFSLLSSHVCVLPAMELLAAAEDRTLQGFLAAGHVCTVTGYTAYEDFVDRHRMPVVVTGFEPLDLLAGIFDCVQQLEAGVARVSNQYKRTVSPQGNTRAMEVVSDVYEGCDQVWRGLGVVPQGGLRLRERWSAFDARQRFPACMPAAGHGSHCPSGDVLTGRIKPTECVYFGRECTPDHPLGAPMVSGEGACAAYYRYALPTVSLKDASDG